MHSRLVPIFIVVFICALTAITGGNGISVTDTKNSPITYEAVKVTNSCYINASGFRDALANHRTLDNRKIWNRLMYVDQVITTGHAVCVFKYENRWKVYDSAKGTFDLGPITRDLTPQEIADLISDKYKNAKWYE